LSASLKVKADNKENIKSKRIITVGRPTFLRTLLKYGISKPIAREVSVVRKKIFIGLMGSKLNHGEIAKVVNGPVTRITVETLLLTL
jgi:hypothetical protein